MMQKQYNDLFDSMWKIRKIRNFKYMVYKPVWECVCVLRERERDRER